MHSRPFKKERERLGLSQRELAGKAGIAYKTLQLLESGRHDPRWSTLTKIGRALGLPPARLASVLAGAPAQADDDSAQRVSEEILEQGEASWKIFLFEFVDAFYRNPGPDLIARAPDPRSSHRVQALLASTTEFLCGRRMPAPWWCAGVPPLPQPWFVAETENLKAAALVESPAQFRRRNIFVLGNFLERA